MKTLRLALAFSLTLTFCGAAGECAAPPTPNPSTKETKASFKRRNTSSEEVLRQQLAGAVEVGLGKSGASLYERYIKHGLRNEGASGSKGVADASTLLRVRPDLASLGLRDGPRSQLPTKAAVELGALSRKMRAYLQLVAPVGEDGVTRDLVALRFRLREDMRGRKPEWLRAEAVPAINQMLMAEDAPTRRLLVELLAEIPQKPATLALAQRASFDLNAEVRAAAVAALKGRDPEAWRPALLKAMSYPWPPPADFAAEALVHLNDKGAVNELVAMLRDPQPGRPVITPDRRVVIHEVVKINHNQNCMLCHAPAIRGDEPVLGVDPLNTRPANPLARGPNYQERKNPTAAAAIAASAAVGKTRVPNWVRADVTFLRQDFSVSIPVAAPLPPVRFDLVVRARPIDGREWSQWKAKLEGDNPQRESVLFALRELTGKNPGSHTEDWVKEFPLAEAEVKSGKLADRLVRAEPIARLGMLQTYQAASGIEHTWALGKAIARLTGPAKEAARLALIQRLANGPDEDLRKCLDDKDPELRKAAEAASARKSSRGGG